MLTLDELLAYAEDLKADETAKISLYFVTRQLKPGMTKTAKTTDKYEFRVSKAPISPSIATFFKETLANQIISHGSKDDINIKKYTVIDDDIDNKIYTYANNSALSFFKLVNENLKSDKIPEITDLSDVQKDLWAYCIQVDQDGEFTYSFRKTGQAKVTTNEPQNILQKLSAMFDKPGGELKEFDGKVISFDDKIDCIYIGDEFYVFHKKAFEAIAGLESEFTQAAQETLIIIKNSGLVEGLELLEQAIIEKPSYRKTLAHIAEKGNHTGIDKNEIATMNEVAQRFLGRQFKTNTEGQIVLETPEDGKNFLKLLNDYYKQGMTTRKYYATDSGSVVDPAS